MTQTAHPHREELTIQDMKYQEIRPTTATFTAREDIQVRRETGREGVRREREREGEDRERGREREREAGVGRKREREGLERLFTLCHISRKATLAWTLGVASANLHGYTGNSL